MSGDERKPDPIDPSGPFEDGGPAEAAPEEIGGPAPSESFGADTAPAAQEPLPPAGSVVAPYGAKAGSPPAYGGDSTADDRLMSALAWLCAAILQVPLVSLVLLLAEGNKESSFQRYHAIGSIVFWLAAIVYEILAVVVYLVLGIITLGVGLVCLWPIFFLPHLVALYYAYVAYIGRRPVIPVITEMMRSQGWAR